jgi:hypothetical protein
MREGEIAKRPFQRSPKFENLLNNDWGKRTVWNREALQEGVHCE